MIYARKRCERNFKPFLEFFVHYVDGHLTLPRASLDRFTNRLLQPPISVGLNIFMPVDSKASGPTKRTLDNIKLDGAWITHADTIPRGSLGTLKGLAVYYGVPIDPSLEHLDEIALYNVASQLWPDCKVSNEPYVMYHGTSRALVKNILTDGLKPTTGMLGIAVYFGSFWKAFRFSVFTQNYERRPGAILRVYCFPKLLPLIKTVASDKCKCEKCTINNSGTLCDHMGLWQKVTDMVIAWPTPGAPIKNEECAMPDGSLAFIDSVAHASCTTDHHEPLNRSLVID